DSEIEVEPLPTYVSRGGEKLESALQHWNLSVHGEICLDVGASTGGFTDCLLQHGAKNVYAVDVGHGQFHPKLRQDPRVRLYENCHILKWQPPWLKNPKTCEAPTLTTTDLSFISMKSVLAKLTEIVSKGSQILILVKPQFEVHKRWLEKGIVKDTVARKKAIDEVTEISRNLGFQVVDHFPCPLKGVKGNREEWLYLRCL
ncbi:MAG: TlyA family RNA methyltransferase, partial [Elusimicrobia bacterium]|nr:TlyA family RNA methyltransferase [Elusimicrobiota bacterium]